jgi:hypothetical protein
MKVKIHWIIDGVAEIEADSEAAAEALINDQLSQIVNANPVFTETLGARAIQGKAYLPGSGEDGSSSS